MKRLLILLSIAVGAVVAAGAIAFAAWHVSASASTATAKSAVIATGAKPTVSVSGPNVTVSWSAAAAPVSSYVVKSYNASTNASRSVGAACAGTVASTSCTENDVPNGSWKYTVTPIQNAWTGTEGPKSDAATVNVAPPTVAITFPTATYYRTTTWNAGCSSTICGTAASAGSTVTNVKVSVKQNGTNLYWNGSAFSSATEVFTTATGTTSWSLSFPAGAAMTDGAYTVHAVATDANSLTGEASVVATMDNTAPTGTISVPAFITNGDGLSMATITETGSGVASAQYLYCSGGSCTPSTVIGSSSTSPDYAVTWNSQPASGTYRVGVKLTDVAGNVSAVVGVQSVTIDHGAPTGTMNSLPTFIKNGQTLSMSSATDSSSGVASVQYLYCSGASCTPSTSIGTSTTASSYSVTWNSQPADGTYRVQAKISDVAGNTTTVPSTPMTVTIDNSAPTGTMTAKAYARNGDALTMASTNDGTGSGVASVQYLYCSGASCTPSTSIGTSTTASSYSVTWNSQPADGSYRVGVKLTDVAGNVSAVTGIQAVTVDNTAPTGTMSALPSITNNGDTLSMSATADGGSGVASVQYFFCNTGGSCTPSTSIGSSTSSGTGFGFVWNGQPADGAYRLAAKVTDNAGNVSGLSAVVSTTVDNNAPTGTLATLVTPFRNSESLSMSSGTVTDNGGSGVASVQYLYCAGSSCTPNTTAGTVLAAGAPTYTYTWDTSALAGGTYRVSATLTDVAGNTSALLPVQTLTLDRSGPTISNVSIPNGGTSQRLDTGDSVVVTFSELLDTHSLCSAWSGTGSQSLTGNNDVTVTVTHGTGSNHDVLTVSSASCTFNFGSLDLGSNTWVSSTRTFKGTGSGKSTIAWSSSSLTLTITLGNGTAGNSLIGAKPMVYTPDPDIADALGNPIAVSSYSFTDGF